MYNLMYHMLVYTHTHTHTHTHSHTHTLTHTQAVTTAYLVNFIFGTDFWHVYVLPAADLNAAYTLKWVLIGSFFFSFPMSLWNIVAHYRSTPR